MTFQQKNNTVNAPSRRNAPVPPDDEWLAIRGLTFLAENKEVAERFFLLTGLDPGSIRAAAREPGFVTSLLDLLLDEDAILESFARQAGCRPEDVVRAREARSARERWSGDD